MPTISEVNRRRADFIGGESVVLADGQAYFIPKPRALFCLDAGENGYRAVLSLDPADDYQDLLDRLNEARRRYREFFDTPETAEPEVEGAPTALSLEQALISAQAAVFKALLLRNYEFTPAELSKIVRWSYNEEESPELFEVFEQLRDVSEGHGKKPKGGGSDAPSSSEALSPSQTG